MTNFNIFGGEAIDEVPVSSNIPLIGGVFESEYKDDFADSDQYHRILFNSGNALQARELTQMQTIIQREIGRFGSNLFKEGAAVNPGNATTSVYEYVTVTTGTYPTDDEALKGGTIVGDSGIVAEVLEVVKSDGSDPDTLYIKYTSTSNYTGPSNVSPRFGPSEDLTVTQLDTNTITLTTLAVDQVGRGLVASTAGGDFFVGGHFVFATPQSILVSKYTDNPSAVVGFIVIQDIVTAADNEALYDNQGPNPNYTAPGADRHRIRLKLATEAEVDSDDNFVFYCNIVEGTIVEQVTGDDGYNKIRDLIATRTKEESGDYIVNAFDFSLEADSDRAANYDVKLSSGIAYVNGYRARHVDLNENLAIARPVSTTLINAEITPANYGNYVVFEAGSSGQQGIPNTTNLPEVNLYDALNGSGTVIGTCRIRAVVTAPASQYHAHLFDINMVPLEKFSDVLSIGTSAADYINPITPADAGNQQPTLRETATNDLLFDLPYQRPESFSDIINTVQRRFEVTSSNDATPFLTVAVAAAGETLVDTSSWIVTGQGGDIVPFSVTVTGQTSAVIFETGGDLASSSTYYVHAMVSRSAAAPRIKTLVSGTATDTLQLDADTGAKYFPLGKADVFSLDHANMTDSDGQDISAAFVLDDGQRDNFYGLARLVLKPGFSEPAVGDNVFARFDHFEHGAGDFFCVNSYQATAPYYNEIPEFRKSGGRIVNLRDVLDFRPVQDAGGNFDTPATGAVVCELPAPGGVVYHDSSYYNGRKDVITIDQEGVVAVVAGKESIAPKQPVPPYGVLPLWNVTLSPNTLNVDDIQTTRIDARHYTMADIGSLEDQLLDLKETTSLSLLEAKTETWNVVDEAGLSRTKSGFFVDNFVNDSMTDVQDLNLRASIDVQQEVVRPDFGQDNLGLTFDPSNAVQDNVVLKGDNLYLAYTHVESITQLDASGTENINPFLVVLNQGDLKLSPSSDNWTTINNIADENIDGGTTFSSSGTRPLPMNLWNQSEWGWHGTTDGSNPQVGDARSNRAGVVAATVARNRLTGNWARRNVRITTQRITSIDTTRTRTGSKIIDALTVNNLYSRARKISFQADGLRPNTTYFPFFDKRDVSEWCRPESTFNRVAESVEDYGDNFKNAIEHPDGAGQLISNANGTVIGSFFLPNNKDVARFGVGTKVFSLLDVGPSSYKPDDALSKAFSNFTTSGTILFQQDQFTSTRNVTIGSTTSVAVVDPLAQSIYIEPGAGMFLTKVDVFFSSKPSVGGPPVRMEIRPMVNGVPSSETVMGTKTLQAAEVNASTGSPTLAQVRTAPTTFEFDEPVYLSAETGYAFVLLADSTAYNVFVATQTEFQLGSTQKRVRTQPSLGSLFKSQNGKTWDASQNQDMMFKIYSANFTSSSGTVLLSNKVVPPTQLVDNPFYVDLNNPQEVLVNHPLSGHVVGDTVNISRMQLDTVQKTSDFYAGDTYNGLDWATDLEGDRIVTKADGMGYGFAVPTTATVGGVFGGVGKQASRNIQYDLVRPEITTLQLPGVSVDYSGRFTRGSSLAGDQSSRFLKNAGYAPIDNREWNLFDNTRMMVTRENDIVSTEANDFKSMDVLLDLSTSNPAISPVIDLQTASVTMIHNHIDKQPPTSTELSDTGYNIPIRYIPETAPNGASGLSKHIGLPITLAQPAVGLTVFLAVNRPAVCGVFLYYRNAEDGQNISEQSWILTDPVVEVSPSADEFTFKEYEYLVGGLGGTMDPFTQFQLKIVFTSTNSSFVPQVRDLRSIALAV
jgi:hypothetical protein